MYNSQDELLILRNFFLIGKAGRAPRIISVRWQPPPPGWTKVNIDGSARGQPGQSSCGGVFRNCRGFVKGCFSRLQGTGFAFEAELVAAMTALSIDHFKGKGWTTLWIESDSTYVVTLLRSRSHLVPWNHRNRCLLTLHHLRNHSFTNNCYPTGTSSSEGYSFERKSKGTERLKGKTWIF